MTRRRPPALRHSRLGLALLFVGCATGTAPDSAPAPGFNSTCQTPGCEVAPPIGASASPGGSLVPATAEPTVASSPEQLFQRGQPATSCDATLAGQLGYTPLRRLTQTQYQKTVEDLFMSYGIGVGAGVGQDVPGDGLAGAFPSNETVNVSEQHVRAFETSAEVVAATVTADASIAKLVTQCAPTSGDPACAQAFITEFAGKAFRHPVSSEQLAALTTVFQAGAATGFRDGVALVVEAVLQSPEFLYHVESKIAAAGADALDPSELAARISYFLWNSLPDAELTRAAKANELSDEVMLRAQAERMMRDNKGERTVRLFTYHWLALGQAAVASVDRASFPQYSGPSYNKAALDETHAFMQHLLRGAGTGTMEQLFTGSYGFPNAELASAYGSAVSDGVTPVELPAGQRAGVLTQAGFLLAHSDPEFKTSAIRRGATVVNNFLCYSFRLPDNLDIDLNIPEGAPGQSARDRLEQHTAAPVCRGCHGAFNPVGFTFDRFDAIGKIRDTDPHGNKLRDDAVLAIGDSAVDGPTMGPLELGRKIANSDRGKACMVRQMYRHALSRMETPADTCTLLGISQRFAGSNFDIRKLMLEIVTSEGFRKRHNG